MMNSNELFEKSLKIAPGGVHSPVRAFKSVGGTPIFFKSASGCTLTSVEGRQYTDFCMSFGPLILGHRDPEVQEAVMDMIYTAWSFGACEPYSLELAEWITARLPLVEKLRFVSSGTEAVMSALRVARAATGRNKILKFDGCYHGHVDSMLVKAGSGLAGLATTDSAGVSAQVAGETLVAPLDDDDAIAEIFNKHGKDIAAIIIEPLPANYGLLIQRKEFLTKVAAVAKSNGSLLIFDEVISGFRVALGGMAEQLNMKPDLFTFGKVLGGGFNVACYGGRRDLLDMVAPAGPVYQAGTLSANPVGMRAGLATLKRVEKLNLYPELNSRTETFIKKLNQDFQAHDIPVQGISFASIFWLHAKTNNTIRTIGQIPAGHKESYAKLFFELLNEGVYLAPSGYEVGFVSWAHTPDVLDSVRGRILVAAKRTYGR